MKQVIRILHEKFLAWLYSRIYLEQWKLAHNAIITPKAFDANF